MPKDLFEEALDELLNAIEEISDLEAAEEYRLSIADKHDSMREWYEDHGALTDAQLEAIENMTAGARRWLH